MSKLRLSEMAERAMFYTRAPSYPDVVLYRDVGGGVWEPGSLIGFRGQQYWPKVEAESLMVGGVGKVIVDNRRYDVVGVVSVHGKPLKRVFWVGYEEGRGLLADIVIRTA